MLDLAIRRRGASFLAACVLAAFLGGCGGGSVASSTDNPDPDDDDTPPPNVTVMPSQDVYVDQSAPSTNFNTNMASCAQCRLSLKVMPSNPGQCWTYIKYDVRSALPVAQGRTITIVDANLHIQYLGGVIPSTDDDVTFSAYTCAQPWAEGAITWNKRVAYGSRIGSVLVKGTRFDCYLPISAATVQSWVDAAPTNYGLVLIGSGGIYTDSCKTMPSREYNPKGITLDINYTFTD